MQIVRDLGGYTLKEIRVVNTGTNKVELVLIAVSVGKNGNINHAVTFIYQNGTDNMIQLVESGGKAIKPIDPIKAEDSEYTYEFIGWYNGENEYDFDSEVTSNLTLTAKYQETKKDDGNNETYSVTFVFGNGEENRIESVKHGKKVSRPTDPTKEESENYYYRFIGWFNGDTEYDFNSVVTSNLVLTARWEEKPNSTGQIILDKGY